MMSISTHLITPRLNAVFLHVQDVKRAAAWYHQLLQLPFDASRVSSPVYNLPLEGPTSLTLDDHTNDATYRHHPSPHALFNFYTTDIDASYQFVRSLHAPIIRDIERFDDFAYFTFSDPDGNVLMLCTG
ncbi:hypothetical protein ESP131_11535 [Exiguobacterium sp. U13-1]|nr:hypothetical protein ESP131_11535 [Exiguobacterium sp. U13-1]